MTDPRLYELSRQAGIVGGILTGAFWLMTIPMGTFVGADVPRHVLWAPAQLCHTLGALAAVFALAGIWLAQRDAAGTLGVIGVFTIVAGTIFFLADGMIALSIFPVLSRETPHLVTAAGAMNRGPVLVTFIVVAVFNMVGNLLFSIATIRAGVFPRVAALLLLVGGVVFNLPPAAVPMPILALGGLLWSAGLIWLSVTMPRAAMVARRVQSRTA